MPELPEVEVVRRGLAAHCVGARVGAVTVADSRSLRRHTEGTPDFCARLTGLRIADIARRGKYLWVLFHAQPHIHAQQAASLNSVADPADTRLLEDFALVIHLGMSGQVLLKEGPMPAEKHQKIVLKLEDATDESGHTSPLDMRFVDQRIFGGMFLSPLQAVTGTQGQPLPGASMSVLGLPLIPEAVAHIARDPLDPHFDSADFRRRMLSTSTGIKKLLLDQSAISGVGNIYADEALWRAKLHYAKPARTITPQATRELVKACQEVMNDALTQGGTSFDALYVNVNGESGYFDRSLKAYGQAGHPCCRCLEAGRTSLMVREPFGGRSSYRCPYCQRKPRGVQR
ncbi:bifunctional DNA-formamidopyrimidine glycosylase/DNA-(apurinic or apyrimidinic site) lyase [Rothia sp. P4278]|uniref:bifunctional DNA-formamidopyrimidine glycosylase/DNA-(apurinic or apyrimidinic site) lyase n=1 Tax=Rothia sp. P4278 TaxID=3402658 RepID=UPI003AEC243B